MLNMDKGSLLKNVIIQLTEMITLAEEGLNSVRKDVNESATPSQSHSDTTRFQMSNIENEVARSLQEKKAGLLALTSFFSKLNTGSDVIQVGSLVKVLEDITGKPRTEIFFVLPFGGGLEVNHLGQPVTVIGENSPLATGLIGHKSGHDAEVKTASGRTRKLIIIEVL